MLKKRIIPVQLLVNGRLVKTRQFGAWRDVGDPVASSRVYNAQNADELIFLSIERTDRTIQPLFRLLDRVSEVSFMPLSVGGGIHTFEDAASLIRHGADKVVINSALHRDPSLVTRIADAFGSQAVIAAFDARWDEETERHVLYADCGRARIPGELETHIAQAIERGAGEVFIQSIDRDGMMTGYDIPLIQRVRRCCSRPIIACGGAGNFSHMQEAFLATDVSALACGSLFNFGDNNPIRAMAFLSNYGIPFKVV